MSDEIITVKIGDEKVEIKAQPLTVLIPDKSIFQDIELLGALTLESPMTIQHAETVQNLHPDTWKYFIRVLPQCAQETLESIQKYSGSGAKHVLGLLDATLRGRDMGLRIHWRFPESHLHPAAVLKLADVMIELFSPRSPGNAQGTQPET